MFKKYVDEVNVSINSVNLLDLNRAIDSMNSVATSGSKILVIGNGGSAALASHFAIDLLKAGFVRKSNISAFSLVDNSSIITATANDFCYEQTFSWQISQVGRKGDLLFAISSSGNSQNILEAIDVARALDLAIITLTGFDGGIAAEKSDIAIITKSAIGNYGPVEDSHSILCHFIAQELSKI